MLIQANALHLPIRGKSVQCVVTSPPYWGLRDYGVEGQLGLEKTPDEYVANMVAVFREVRRVLKDDGVLWLNLGDSYCSVGHKKSHSGFGTTGLSGGKAQEHSPTRRENDARSLGLKHKDLIGIPWRVAFALQADGWYLRQDIIWHKPNPMPESVKDRCTKAHEYLFMLTKSERYYYDNVVLKEPEVMKPQRRLTPREANPDAKVHGQAQHRRPEGGTGNGFRNRRSVWTIPTQPCKEAHFATFPFALVEPCILAGSRPGDFVLDPFVGSGTVGIVAHQTGRLWMGIELNEEYIEIAHRRFQKEALR